MASTWDLTQQVELVIKFRQDRDWAQFHRPKELAAGLSIEAAELQELFLWREGETAKDVLHDEDRTSRIREELGDIMIFVLMLASDLEIDLPEAVADKLRENAKRYPADEARGRANKAPH